jgi:hypothetical protein
MTRRYGVVIIGIVVILASGVLASAWRGRLSEIRQPPVTYTPTATIKDLMDSIVDPSADEVWNAVTTTIEARGTDEKSPQTDDDWDNVRRGALKLVEGANLLMMPGRHMARSSEKSATPGVELEPHEMETLVKNDRTAWNARAKALQDVSLDVLKAVDAKDADRLFNVGERLDAACESCHRQFWYPNEKIPEFPSDFGVQSKATPSQEAAH